MGYKMKDDMLELVRVANPERNFNSLSRRLIKLMEELGECSEAYLNITSSHNGKGKSEEDLIEELVDTVIVSIDCVLTKPPSYSTFSDEQYEGVIIHMMKKKLAKWMKNKAKQLSAVDDAI
jgi:NTP pyrophosphatase (non-canonical NTP hydrolase)